MHPGGAIAGFVLGAVVSSFGATWALRREVGVQAISGRSRCDACQHDLTYAETIPLIGFLSLKGVCRYCRVTINPFHPIAELLGGILVATILLWRPWPLSIAEGALAIVLYSLALVDLRTLTLPDIGVAISALLAAFLGWQSGDLVENLIVALIFGLALSGFAAGFKRLRRRTMLGMGDIKLIAALTLWLGPDICLAMIISCVLGLMQIKLAPSRPGMIAFGPAIIIGAMVMGFCIRPWFSLGELP